jgi:5-formaminoimidazole-4-carboxamide-1-beta-D-ribofuranosyl 5'-monophosphate synthetase
VIRARTAETGTVKAKITLINKDASSFAAFITLKNNFSDIEVPFNTLGRDSMLVLPVSTPEFMSVWFKGSGVPVPFKLSDMEKIQITIGTDIPASEFKKPYSLEVESIRLQKSK